MDKSYVEVQTSVKEPIARKIMEELDGKISPILGKPYKVIFEDDNG